MLTRDPWRRRLPPGAPPGTIEVHPEAPAPVMRLMAYGADSFAEEEITDPRQVGHLVGQHPVTWLNIDGLGDAELIKEIGATFRLHALALEDVVNVLQRPKVEEYGDQLFIVARMPVAGGSFRTEQLSLFVGESFVISFQERVGDCLEPVRRRLRDGRGRIRGAGADYLTYALLDAVVDSYFPLAYEYLDRIDAAEEEIVGHPDRSALLQLHDVGRDLIAVHRTIVATREAVRTLTTRETVFVKSTRVYLRDCYDHTHQLLELVESGRDNHANLMNLYLSVTSNRMNEIMKVLTIMAALFIPLTFVAGIYGMNFNREASPLNMPELDWYWGYPTALTVMAAVAGAMLLYFRRKKWLG
jgi:magnesium transporter